MAFDPVRYEQEVIRPLRGRHGRLPDDDLARRYAIEPGMSEDKLREHIRKIRMYWNQKATGPDNRAQVCRQLLAADEELKRTEGESLYDPAWWKVQARRREQQAREAVTQLAADLAKAYHGLGQVTRAQLAAIVTHFAGLRQEQIDEAVRQADLRVIDTVELPKSSGLDRTAYRHLAERLGELGVPTIVQLLHPGISKPFTLVQAFTVPGEPRLALDRAVVDARIKAAEAAANSVVLRAGKAALSLLRTGLEGGADLRMVALFQVVEQLSSGRAQGLADVLLIRRATALGLDQNDAELLVASLPTGADASAGSGAATRIRELLEDGQLRAAQQALAALATTDPDRDEVRGQVEEVHAKVERLIREASEAVDARREEDAARLLREAGQLAADDEDLATRVKRLPLPPPREPSAAEVGAAVRLAWKAPNSTADDVRYRVTRTEGRVATSPEDGTQTAVTKETTVLDRQPPVACQLHYAIFASADGAVWSRAAVASVLVTPGPTDVSLRVNPDHVIAAWNRHPAVVAVRVRRTVGRPPRKADEGVAIKAQLDSFTDRDIDEGKEYFYGLVAVYHDSRRREMAAPMVVVSASPRPPATAVESLSVVPLSVSGTTARVRIAWPTTEGVDVRLRYADRRPSWEVGAVVTPVEIDNFGREVVGPRRVDGHELVIDADVPIGQHVYVPFTIGDTGGVLGRPVAVGITEPVRQLDVRRIGAEAVLSWVWPAEAGLVEVVWTTPERGTQIRRMTKAQYVDHGGCRLLLGPGGGAATVSAIAVGPAGEAMSPPASATVAGRALSLSYQIHRPPGLKHRLSRQRLLQVRLDADCADVELVVVAAAGLVMPLRPDQGTVINRYRGITFERDAPLTFEIEIPDRMRRPYWLRCFVLRPERVTVTDPPIDNLKVS